MKYRLLNCRVCNFIYESDIAHVNSWSVDTFLPSGSASEKSSDLDLLLRFKRVTNSVAIKEYKLRSKVLNGTYPFTTYLFVLYAINFDSGTCELMSFNISFIYIFPKNILFILMHRFWAADDYTWSFLSVTQSFC
jgi:hypothetical protein